MSITLTLAIGWAVAAPAPERLDFARVLGDGEVRLSPREAVERAWALDPELDASAARAERAETGVDGARIPLVPRLLLSASVERVGGFPDGAIRTPAGEVGIVLPRDRAALSAELVYPLSRVFLETLPRLSAASARARAETHQGRAVRAAVAEAVLEAYWSYARARGLLHVAEVTLAAAEARRDRLRAGVEAGLRAPADGAAAEARHQEARARLERARGVEATARAALALRIDLDPARPVALPADALAPPPRVDASVDRLESEAARRRAELLALDAARAGTEDELRAEWGERLPEVDLRAGATYAQPNPNVIPPEARFDPSWSVGARLGWSPNRAWRSVTRGDAIRADLRRLEAERERLWRDIRIAIRAALAELTAARRELDAARARVESARAAEEARQEAFQAGRAIFAEVLEADAELARARNGVLEALVDGHVARVRLMRSVGRLTP